MVVWVVLPFELLTFTDWAGSTQNGELGDEEGWDLTDFICVVAAGGM